MKVRSGVNAGHWHSRRRSRRSVTGNEIDMKRLWRHVATAMLLIAAMIIAAAAGRVVEAAIIGVLALLPIAVVVFYVFAKRRGLVEDDP